MLSVEQPAEPEYLKDQIRLVLHDYESEYSAGNNASDQVWNKYFTGVIGPFRIGKTFHTTNAIKLEPELKLINTTTTRARKPEGGDPPGFKTGKSFRFFNDAVSGGALINYSVIPGADIYGTFPEDFTTTYNIGPFLPSGVHQIEQAGFKDRRFIYLVAAGDMWRNFAEKSRPSLPNGLFVDRAFESIDSIQFARRNKHRLLFIENTYNPADEITTAQQIAQIALFREQETLPLERASEYLDQMLDVAQDLTVH